MTETLRGHVVTPDGVVAGAVTFDAVIRGIAPGSAVPDRFILPGFVDGHVHGGGGGDTMDGPEGIATLARFHARHGTTTLLPTTITRPWPEVMAALRGVPRARDAGIAGGAAIAGAHLEGPFISPQRLGAQPPHAILPDRERVAEALAVGVIRTVTIAPELSGAAAAMAQFAQAGVRVSFGHSVADYATARAALKAVRAAGGMAGGTHLFNAMGGIEGRAPGLAGALLADRAAHAELILDTHHVHPGAFLLAHAALGDRLMLITDAIRGAGTTDGESELGGQRVSIKGGVARLADGTMAGSVLTMDQAVRNAVAAGLDLPTAARLAATNPANYLGLSDRGKIQAGLRADLVVLNSDFTVANVWLQGHRLV